ncbi:M16 family metallopeptidase [Hyphococcus luteus]|uniref:Peptidase M16 n=1 Tax=Hyphococcus luteus TaxID=2058213 RepID=A0A2S7K4Y4_9PROT|nr:pitrilysin family protein [Marinicaulis flavus]PQA87536.1 peptidase M16 [Marinicaulis flavus]
MVSLHTLPNGVRVVADPMPELKTAALGVWVRAGSVDERQGEYGIAHLLEHMAFKGTGRRSALAIAEEIEGVGGYLNAATSHQRTGYYARVLKDDLALGADILSDILANPLFDEEELAREREVVVQEIGEAADTPDDVVFEKLTEAAWGTHPLGRPILGTPDSVRAQTRDSLRGFMARCYRPDDMILAAAGGVDEGALLKLAEDWFGGFSAEGESGAREDPHFIGGLLHDKRKIEQTHLAVAFPGVPSAHEDFFATRLYADVLGGGMSSRLFQKIREERGLAYSVYAFADGFENAGLLGAYVNAEAKHIAEAATIIRDEMAATAGAMGVEEVARGKALLRSSLMLGLESPANRIEAAAGQLFTYGALMDADDILARIDAITVEDMQRCADRALKGPCAVSIVGPCKIGPVEAALKFS